MATYVKFQDFAEQVERGVHNFGSHVFKLALTNTLPVNTQTSFDAVTNHAAPVAANGYPSGGTATTVTVAESGGTMTVQGTAVVFTATAGGIGPVRYAVLYNDTATSPADALIAWWDYGSTITLIADTETLTVTFGGSSPGTIHTLA